MPFTNEAVGMWYTCALSFFSLFLLHTCLTIAIYCYFSFSLSSLNHFTFFNQCYSGCTRPVHQRTQVQHSGDIQVLSVINIAFVYPLPKGCQVKSLDRSNQLTVSNVGLFETDSVCESDLICTRAASDEVAQLRGTKQLQRAKPCRSGYSKSNLTRLLFCSILFRFDYPLRFVMFEEEKMRQCTAAILPIHCRF